MNEIDKYKDIEKQKIIYIINSYDFIIYNSIPYIYIDNKYIKCTLDNIINISNKIPVFYIINQYNFNNFINKIILKYIDTKFIKNNDNIIKFQNCFLNFKNFKMYNNINILENPYFLSVNYNLTKKKENLNI